MSSDNYIPTRIAGNTSDTHRIGPIFGASKGIPGDCLLPRVALVLLVVEEAERFGVGGQHVEGLAAAIEIGA